MILRRLLVVAVFALIPTTGSAAEPDDEKPDPFKGLKFRNIGPSIGGRVCRACGVPGDPFTYYAATAGGGVWKSADGGFTWKSIFDDQPVSSIGSIAVAASDPNVIYVGSGEANIRGNVAAGNGIYKSEDAGKTWKHIWTQVGQIGTMIVHPRDPDIAFAAVLGNPFGPGEQRGVFRTRDGGKNWQRVLYRDWDTGASDVCFDPHNPRTLYAGLWQTRRRPWDLTSGGPGSGLYVSHDGGEKWEELGPNKLDKDTGKPADKETGLPKGPWGKICVAVAPSNGNRIYAVIEAAEGGLFRSDDGGEKWERINSSSAIRQRAWYFSTFAVDPANPDVIWFPQVPLLKSVDGGKTLQRVKGPHHGDHHDIWIDPKNPLRMIDANDGGVDVTVNGGATWYAPPLPIGQFYHVACDSRTPYRVAGCLQDVGAYAGPSNSLTKDISLSDWELIGGGEAGHVAYDPLDPDVIYAGEYSGYISRFDRRTRQARNVSAYPFNSSGHGGESLKVRFQWTAPIATSPHSPHALYHAGNVLFRSLDGGHSWQQISPDLTRNDKSKQRWSGGPITGDNTGVETYCTIFAVSESPKQKGVIWAGSDDGLVHVSRDDGKTWSNVTANVPDLPDWATVRAVEPSPSDAGAAYLVVDAHRLSDFRPHVWKTTDFGKTWLPLTAGLPSDEYLHVVRCDPKKPGMLYAGSERGVWFSRDDGKAWQKLKLNLPTTAVHDIIVKGDDLVLGTMGRSAWILDDLTPVREFGERIATAKAHLFAPPPALRWRKFAAAAEPFDRSAGENPIGGAIVTYYLNAKPKGLVTLEVLDAAGKRVALLESKEEKPDEPEDVGSYGPPDEKKPLPIDKGFNRVGWDLKYKGAAKIPRARVDAGNPEDGPLALPGEYTLKLTVEGKAQSAKLTVRPDPRLAELGPHRWVLQSGPNLTGGEAAAVRDMLKKVGKLEFRRVPESGSADLEEQHAFILKVRDDINSLTSAVKQLRSIRKQLAERADLLKDDKAAKDLLGANKALLARLDALEGKFHNPKAKTVYDILAQKGGAKLYSQYTTLYGYALDADGPPTQGLKTVYGEVSAELSDLLAEWRALLAGDVAKYNEQSKAAEIPGLLLPKKPDKKD